jgi:hypothetical protein
VSWLLGFVLAGSSLAAVLLVDLLARRRHRRAQTRAARERERMRRRDELEHAMRVERLRIVGGARPDGTEQPALSPAARGDSAASGLRVDVPEASPRLPDQEV